MCGWSRYFSRAATGQVDVCVALMVTVAEGVGFFGA